MYYFIDSIIKLPGTISDAKIGMNSTCRLIFLDIQFTVLGINRKNISRFLFQ